jgi:hypothetical protein
MKRLPAMILALAAAAFWWMPAAALEADQVRGEIVEVDPDADTLTLRVAESGDARPERVGEVETYEVTRDTVVRRATVGRSITDPTSVTVADLFAGDEVILAFDEVDGRRVARDVPAADERADTAPFETAEQTEAAQFEADERGAAVGTRDRLPATASALPLLALTGLGFAGAALMIRIRRRR